MASARGAGGLYARAFDIAWRYATQIMTTTEASMASHGHFHWNELVTPDAERAKRFYQATIGWTFTPMPMDDGATYWIAHADGTRVAGIFPTDRPAFEGVLEGWMPYLAVDDVDARVTKAVAAGAQLMRPIFDIPDVGRIAILTEPGGAGIGWITPVG
jgi:predicted enzyme related to lactoylglutathione lyase